MTYQQFKQSIQDGQHIPDYYEQVLLHSESILLDISLYGQIDAAKLIGLTQARLSNMKPLLVAFYNLVHGAVYAEPSNQAIIDILNSSTPVLEVK